MKIILLLIAIVIPNLAFTQLPVVASKMYSWEKPTARTDKNILTFVLFEGSVYDMEYLQMSANAIHSSKQEISLQVPNNEEHLLLIKTGILTIGFKDSTWSIGGGSIALLMPGEKYSLQNSSTDSCTFYRMKYRSKLPMDLARGQASGGSFVEDWGKITFKPHDKGGIRNYFEKATAMSKRFEMHVTTLKEGSKVTSRIPIAPKRLC